MTTFSTTRQLAAPPAAVFAAMQDGERLARWWGPAGFTNRFDVFEFHAGGRWVFTMVGPDGTAYPNEAVFSRIEPGHQVVIQHVNQPLFQLTIRLAPSAGGRWVFTMVGPDGTAYPNEAVFSRIEPEHQVVIQHVNQPLFQLTIRLAPSAGGTLLHWDQAFADAAVAQAVRHIVEPANEQNLDRLAAELGGSGPSA
jgi:uncharacterized protein YndB with AHSA1/START domain